MPLDAYAKVVGDDVCALVTGAQLALGFTQRQVAEAVGTSLRTVQRWSSQGGSPCVGELRTLAVLVHPHDAALAAKLAAVIGETLESLGLVTALPPPVAEPSPVGLSALANREPALPPNVMAALAESVVAAAAESMDVSPRVVRPALLAAMERAKSAGLDVDGLLSALRPATTRESKRRRRAARS
jgi:hypothetical protein